ncbi:MAG: methyltransferase domain-containing protein [bacterium]|jgi:ubiquinone/menaquinone biosynthesis C-methylase UbiE|nr:methyltransferase domain-containing protein [bacterium]
MPKRMPIGRKPEDVRHQYEVEKELATRLRLASPEERRVLYSAVYDELFRRCPDHPQMVSKHDPEQQRAQVAMQMIVLGRYLQPGQTFLEVGPGDCSLTVEVAKQVRQCIAVDVSTEVAHQAHWPENMQLIISDGSSIPVPASSVDLAYSFQLMEHLHPDDAYSQLANIFAALKPGGRYICRTPNRLSGPHDISGPFDAVATGFHLREYTTTELVQLFRRVGFRKFSGFIVIRERYMPRPLALAMMTEFFLKQLPQPWTQRLASSRFVHRFLAIGLVATK